MPFWRDEIAHVHLDVIEADGVVRKFYRGVRHVIDRRGVIESCLAEYETERRTGKPIVPARGVGSLTVRVERRASRLRAICIGSSQIGCVIELEIASTNAHLAEVIAGANAVFPAIAKGTWLV